MLFNSTYEENLKRKLVKVEIGNICIADYETSLLKEIDKFTNSAIVKFDITVSDIKFYKKEIDVGPNELSDFQPHLIFYFERPETDKEYQDRIESLQVKDLKEFVDVVVKFNTTCSKKKEIKDLWDKLKHKIRPADWQREIINNFYGEKSAQEWYEEGFKEGREEEFKKNKELKEKIKNLI